MDAILVLGNSLVGFGSFRIVYAVDFVLCVLHWIAKTGIILILLLIEIRAYP